jgi:chromosomal replication initiation ATPase DnaA
VDICLKIAATHGVTLEAMYGPSRARKVAYARFEAWACLQAHGLSTVRIGRIFSRDHSTIVSGLKRRRALAQQEAA